MTLRWILQSPPWQAQPWPLWITGTTLVLVVAAGASAFVVAVAAVVAFESPRADQRARGRQPALATPRSSR